MDKIEETIEQSISIIGGEVSRDENDMPYAVGIAGIHTLVLQALHPEMEEMENEEEAGEDEEEWESDEE
ncbi:hypothetical protein ABK040_015871 [Willaertia magna]